MTGCVKAVWASNTRAGETEQDVHSSIIEDVGRTGGSCPTQNLQAVCHKVVMPAFCSFEVRASWIIQGAERYLERSFLKN